MEYKKPQQQKTIMVDSLLAVEDIELVASDSFTVVSSVNDVDQTVLSKMNTVIDKLKSKAFKFNYNNDGRDCLSNYVFKKYEIFSDIYLPFKNFNKEALKTEDGDELIPVISEPTMKAHKIAAKYKYKKEFDEAGSIRYNSLSETIKKFSARDVHLLLGGKSAMRVKFLIVLTNDVAETDGEIDFKTTGSAAFPIKLANVLDIPVFNINKPGRLDDLLEYIEKL